MQSGDVGRRASAVFYRSDAWAQLRRVALERDCWRCQAPGCGELATHVDHIARRPFSSVLTPADVLGNLRSLCARHDAQVKELASGARRNGGRLHVIGSNAEGWPLDPSRR